MLQHIRTIAIAGIIAMGAWIPVAQAAPLERAIFAGGCFWCMEKPFEHLAGVSSVVSGYTGGNTVNPSYANYAQGGHVEVVEILFDPQKVTYRKLLNVFWKQINPTDAGGQFVDRGPQYASAIYYLSEEQKAQAETSKAEMDASARFGKPIVTPIKQATEFYAAEEYHQDYYQKNPARYWYYRSRSGRDDYLESIWGKDNADAHALNEQPMDKQKLKQKLTPLQYE
ncbi:MAG: peptide-methionine (S)-S-oxide reductase MsrA, partial [Mariprofundaceae bacterium]|nr:peptide-methionine (S)-S-oxide reductase MsrA [Mariprofundaceae bacterium]